MMRLQADEANAFHPTCPCCEGAQTTLVGPLPASTTFAGRHLADPLPGGGLWKCRQCHLSFRYPAPAKDKLDALYETGSPENWQDGVGERADWNLAANILADHPEVSSILDVGCFDGTFLTSLSQKYEKLGIEIHPQARDRASGRGVQLIGHDLSILLNDSIRANFVTAFDVIEHTLNPLEFMMGMRNAVATDGLLLISTGNASAWSWRFMGSRYWYCAIGEHMTFICPAWCDFAARRLGLDIVSIVKFSHAGPRASTRYRLRELIKNVIYRMSPWATAKIRSLRVRKDPQHSRELSMTPPDWVGSKDHILVVFRKKVEIDEAKRPANEAYSAPDDL